MKNKRQSGREKLTVLNVLLAIALIGSVAFVIYSKTRNRVEPIKEPPKKESVFQAVTAEKPEKEEVSEAEKAKKAELVGKYSEEVTFDKPIDIVWKGKIMTFFQSGKDYGIEKIPKDENYPYFYAGIYSDAFPEHVAMDGNVEVTGKWTGITCAYQNTVFKRCVPDVEVKQISMAGPPKNNGEIDWSQPFEFFTANFSDDNFPDVYQETYTGGAHCCFKYKAFVQTGEKSIIEVPIKEQNHALWPKDVNNDGIDELAGYDSTFDYWNASYADSQAPEIILSFNPGKKSFDLNTSLMKKPAPSQEELREKFEEIESDKDMNSRGNIEGFPSPMWGYILDLIYSGNEKSAWEFFDLAWPKSKQGKDDFQKEFQNQLEKSPYSEEIKKLNSDNSRFGKTDNKKVDFQVISFKNGPNDTDLNSDGIQDMVVKSFRNNGTSPHSYNVYDFFINKPASQYTEKEWVIVQIDKDKNDKDAINIEYDNDVSTSEGAEVVLKDVRVIKTKDKRCLLVIAKRDFGESYVSEETVNFDIYEMRENTTGDNDPDYYFNYLESIKAKNKYVDVNEAMDKELNGVINSVL